MFLGDVRCKYAVLAKTNVCDEYTRSAGPEKCKTRAAYALSLTPICDENRQSRVPCALIFAQIGARKRYFQPKIVIHEYPVT